MNHARTMLYIVTIVTTLVFCTTMVAQEIDAPSLDMQPGPLPATKFVFPSSKEFVLENGLHVFVIEDHSLPRVTFSLIMKTGDAYDLKGKEGTATMAGDMLLKGNEKVSAQDIAKRLDGVGAALTSTSSGEQTSISGAALKKHIDLLVSTLGEALIGSTYPADEFEKLRQQYIANVASEQSRPGNLAAGLSRKVIYGMDHPIARAQSKASLSAITIEDVRNFHTTWHRPNISSIAVVGDITTAEVKKLLTKYLKDWKKTTIPDVSMPPMATEKAGVYFIPRPGSVQSSVVVCAPAPSVTADDWMALDIAVAYTGSGFGSLLFKTLRETYSYTYSPFAYVTRGNRYNRASLGADVRTSVTDSAITVILREVRGLGQSGPNEQALERRVAYEVGQYRLAYEKVANVASALQLAWVCNMPVSWVAEWTDRIEGIGYGQVTEAAHKYLDMFRLRIVVVGDPSIVPKLEQFGPVMQFDADYKPLTSAVFEDAGMSVDELVEAYATSIGGRSNIASVKTVSMSGPATMNMQGQTFKGTVSRKVMLPNSEASTLDLGVMKQSQWTDGTKAWISLDGGEASEADAEETTRLKREARLFPVLTWREDGLVATMLGKKDGQVFVKVVAPSGRMQRYIFDEKTRLLVQTEKDEDTPQGPITVVEKLSDYKEVSGVKFPTIVQVESPIYNLKYDFTVEVNTGVQGAEFQPAAK